MDKTLLPLSFLLAAGCACTPGQEPEPRDPGNDLGPPIARDCPAEDYQGFVGSPLAAVTYPSDLEARIIEPGQAVTMDYKADRMNIRVDEDGVITRVYCG